MLGKFLASILGALLVLFTFTFAGQLEGWAFPVTSNTGFSSVEPISDSWSRINGLSFRERDCAFQRIEVTTQFGTVADLIFEEGTKDRGNGWFEFGPWKVQMTPAQLEESIVYVYHKCHPFWLTRTQWYP